MVKANHWGVYVDSDEPTTGVLQNNEIEFLQDAMFYEDGVNLSYEAHCQEYHTDPTDPDLCFEDADDDEHECYWNDDPQDTWIIGDWCKDSDGKYEPVKNGPRGYAAIVGEIYTQVVWSTHTTRCALCSPCYPGQGDIGSDGQFLAYTMPPEYMGDSSD